jgi:hypothetical protein
MNSLNQIDTFEESIISADEAAEHVAKLTGKKRNRNMVLRWMNRGVGGVILSSIRIGSEIYTSREKLNEFMNASRQARKAQHSAATSAGMNHRRVELEAKQLGI